MRLDILDNGHTPEQKLVFAQILANPNGRVSGPMLTMSYRRDLFGKYIAECFQEAMRESTEWSIGDVELFAAFVSSLNECKY